MRKPDVSVAIESYKDFLANAQAQHERTISQAYSQLQALIDQSARSEEANPDPPQSVWITGNDGEPFLMMNKAAADSISNMIERLKDVVAELAKQVQAKK
jgi:hypothetical protein